MAPTSKDIDPLDHLEERIQKAVTLVNRLREEKEALATEALKEMEASATALALEKEASARAIEQERETAARAVAQVKEAAAKQLQTAADEREAASQAAARQQESDTKVADALRVSLEEAQNANTHLTAELEAMREERKQVRGRLEKLLGHIDQLGAA